ncbi:MAG: alpha-galactosidase, partial [Proteobacteria bacterium]|nr:alpha-galactosidase [Pseudomonadota bacterium]
MDARPAIVELRATAGTWNWVHRPISIRPPQGISADGTAAAVEWQYVGASWDDGERTLRLSYQSKHPHLEYFSLWHAPRGRGPVEHTQYLKNLSGGRITVGAHPSLQLDKIHPPKAAYVESTQVFRGGSDALMAGGTQSQPVGEAWETVVPSRPSDGGKVDFIQEDRQTQIPFLMFQVDQTQGLYVGWAFSGAGQIRGHAVQDEGETALDLSVGLESDFLTDIDNGETLEIPKAILGAYRGAQSDGSYSLHRYVLDSLLPRRDDALPLPTLGYAYYYDGNQPGTQTEQDVLASAQLAKSLGFETYLVDAMWFPQSGDWRWDPSRFPHGAKPIADFLHANGMHFGLWMAWTQASTSTDPGALTYEAHPGWFTHVPIFAARDSAPAAVDNINWTAQIDVGNDQARSWVETETQRVVRDYGIDYLKTDFSPIAIHSEAQPLRGNHKSDVSYWSTLGYYRIQSQLLEHFPHLRLEGCSMGGKIKDFGNIAHVHAIVGTDTLSALTDRQSLYDTSVMFPPSTIELYTYDAVYSAV